MVHDWLQALAVKALGFAKARAQRLGTPPYDPGDLLRLYIWGYLSAIHSSRALERECHRNVECVWLLGRLAPEHVGSGGQLRGVRAVRVRKPADPRLHRGHRWHEGAGGGFAQGDDRPARTGRTGTAQRCKRSTPICGCWTGRRARDPKAPATGLRGLDAAGAAGLRPLSSRCCFRAPP